MKNENKSEYNRIDLTKLKYSENHMTSEEALRDVIPIQWSNEVLEGNKKVIISKQK